MMEILFAAALSKRLQRTASAFWNRLLPLASDDSTSKFVASATRISDAAPLTLKKPVTVTPGAGTAVLFHKRDEAGNIVSNSGWSTSPLVLPAGVPISLLMKKTDNSMLVQSDVYRLSFDGSGSGEAEANQAARTEISRISSRKGVAHRCGAVGPENVLQTCQAAAQCGFQLVETDVAFTADDVPVLLHDNTINRTARNMDGSEIAETIQIGSITYNQALTYDFGVYKGSAWAGTRIPTLADFFAVCLALGLKPYVELKAASCTPKQSATLVALAQEAGIERQMTWISASDELLEAIRAADPEAELGWVINAPNSETTTIDRLLELGAFADINASNLSSSFALRCKTNNIPIDVWTVNKVAEVLALPEEVRNVTTDYLWGIEMIEHLIQNGEINQMYV